MDIEYWRAKGNSFSIFRVSNRKMNTIRFTLNFILTFFCFLGGAYLLERGEFFLRDRWHPGMGTYFAGLPLYLLSCGLFFLGVFSAAVAMAWMKGAIAMPDPRKVRPHPVYKGQIILRYWYLVVPAILLVLGAFILSPHVPAPHP